MRALLFIFLVFISAGQSFAQTTYFEFVPASRIISLDNEVEVSMLYELVNLEESQFKIRPISENGFVQIWNETSQKWVFEKALWDQIPNLNRNIKLKFLSDKFSSTKAHFQILDTKTTTIYTTPKHKIWSRGWFEDYVTALNKRILRVVE